MINYIQKLSLGLLHKIKALYHEPITDADIDQLAVAVGFIQTALDGCGTVELVVERGKWRLTKIQMCAHPSMNHIITLGVERIRPRKKAVVPRQTIKDIEIATALIKCASGFGTIHLDVADMRVSNFSITFSRQSSQYNSQENFAKDLSAPQAAFR